MTPQCMWSLSELNLAMCSWSVINQLWAIPLYSTAQSTVTTTTRSIHSSAGVKGMSGSPEWMTAQSVVPKGGVTSSGVEWLLFSISGKAIVSKLYINQLLIAAKCPVAPIPRCQGHIKCHLCYGYKMWRLTTERYSLSELWASLWTSITIYCMFTVYVSYWNLMMI